jgi:hypothetical protein
VKSFTGVGEGVVAVFDFDAAVGAVSSVGSSGLQAVTVKRVMRYAAMKGSPVFDFFMLSPLYVDHRPWHPDPSDILP